MEYVLLSDVGSFSDERISIGHVTVDNYISTENMVPNKGGVIQASSLPDAKKVSKYNPGDILLSNIRPYFKKIWFADCIGGCSNDVLVFHPNKDIDAKFLYYVLSDNNFFNYATLTSNGTKLPRGTKRAILKYWIPNLSLATQQKVASILSAYDSQIENNQKRIKLLEQMAENLYKEWFVRFRFPGFENAEFEGGVPKGWNVEKLKKFITFYRGKSYSSDDISSGDYVLLSMNNIRPWGGYIRDDSRVYGGSFKDFQLIHKGDLIMSITDMTQDRRIIGYVGIFDEERDDCIMSTHLMKVVSEYNNYYLYGLFNFSLSRNISEYATGANVLGLTDKILKEIKALVPPEKLISQYGKMVRPVWEEIFHLKDEIANLTKQRDLLLPRLISGKLRI